MRPQRGWLTRTLVLTVVVLVTGALVTVGSAWADQGYRRSHHSTKTSHVSAQHRSHSGQHADSNGRRVVKHRDGDTHRHSVARHTSDRDDRSRRSADRAQATQSKLHKAATSLTHRQPRHQDSAPVTARTWGTGQPSRAKAAPIDAAAMTPTTSTVPATAAATTGSPASSVSPAAVAKPATVVRQLAAISSPTVAFSSSCEPSGRRVTTTITNGSATTVTATITTAAHRTIKEVAAARHASVVVHLAIGKAVVVTVGGDHVSYLAPACTEPAPSESTQAGSGGSTGATTPGVALSLERACEIAGEPVAVRVTNPAAVTNRLVIGGTSHAVPAGATISLPVPDVATGEVVTVSAGPTRYELTVPPCPAVAALDTEGQTVLHAGLTGGTGGGLDSDVVLIVAGLAAVALSAGVLVVAAARRLRWARLR